MSYGVVSPGHLSRGYNQMLPPARKRGCLAENSPAPNSGSSGAHFSLAYTCIPDLPATLGQMRACVHAC